ncbi:S-layer homology domain-containing protein [bacterium]|nr:S-layer homology domain-containing protein [bacterium]
MRESFSEDWIEQLAAEGITSGYPDGTFKPDRTVTRAEMAVFLVNAFGLPIL